MMNDRFKFKAVLHQNKYEEYQLEKFLHQRVFDVMSINFGIEYSTIDIIAEYPNGDWAVREIDDKDIDLIQCTGLKDKNGKLIYEGDILKGKKDTTTSPHSSIMVDRVGVVEIPQDMFVASCRDVKNNCTLFCQFDWVNVEVIGNIYENKELIDESKK